MTEVYPLEDELTLFDPQQLQVWRNEFDELCVRYGQTTWTAVRIVRSFPHSDRGRLLSVRTTDGAEAGLIPDLRQLDAETREVLQAELERLYFVPTITAVHAIVEQFHVPRWEVETDRGPRSFEIRSGRRDVRVLGVGRILIRDADGNQFEIPDWRRLDAASRRLIESQI